tara:strand:+ start:884 stop:2638 length:1755 start_codon:yes stop_codon:yes gene_type:complete
MFKAWLYLIESGEAPSKAYERIWKPRFDKIEPHRQKNFAHLFPDGNRLYFPIKVRAEDMGEHLANQNKNAVEQVQRIFKYTGAFIISDWEKGLARDNRKNTWKIAKALEFISTNSASLEKLKQGYGQGLSDGAGNPVKMTVGNATSVAENAKRQYLELKHRLNPVNNYNVVISIDAHDIAKMSTTRSWESCRTLSLSGDKKYGYIYADIARELLKGGLIAYLAKPDDKELKSPISRMMIRRYEEEITGDQFLACTDGTLGVFGVQNNILPNFVQKWLKKIQKKPAPGFYSKQGGKFVSPNPYDITVGTDRVHRGNAKKIIELLKGYFKQKEPDRVHRKFDSLMGAVLRQIREQGVDSVPKSFWKEYKKLALAWGQQRKELGYLLRREPDAFTFDEILSLDPIQARDMIGGAAGESFYSYMGDKEGQHWRDKWKDYNLKELKKLLDTRMGKLDVGKFIKVINHSTYEIAHDGELMWKVLDKIERIINAPIKRDTGQMGDLIKGIIGDVRYGWNIGHGQDVPKKQMLQAGARIAAAGQHFLDRRWDQYEVQALIKDLEEEDIKVPKELESWREKEDLRPKPKPYAL